MQVDTIEAQLSSLPVALKNAIQHIYLPANLPITNPRCENDPKGTAYSACRLFINDQAVAFRVAKLTPTKIGQFVTTWKRPKPGSPIMPFDNQDGIQLIIVHVKDQVNEGQFVFDKATLIAQGIMAHNGRKGKLAFRIYPPWSKPTAYQALSAQQWQLKYFYPIDKHGTANTIKVQQLFKHLF